jgi:hypothetical protein
MSCKVSCVPANTRPDFDEKKMNLQQQEGTDIRNPTQWREKTKKGNIWVLLGTEREREWE